MSSVSFKSFEGASSFVTDSSEEIKKTNPLVNIVRNALEQESENPSPKRVCRGIKNGSEDTPIQFKSGIPFCSYKNTHKIQIDLWSLDDEAKGDKIEAKKRINKAFELKSSRLDLSNLKLTKLPPIKHLSQLKVLDISANKLFFDRSEPSEKIENPIYLEELLDLKNLEELYISDNGFKAFPAALFSLGRLIVLDLSQNSIKEIPDEIGVLRNLEALLLYDNEIEVLTEELGNLKKLVHLSLSENYALNYLPYSLRGLENLQSVDIDNTQIDDEDYQEFIKGCLNSKLMGSLEYWIFVGSIKRENFNLKGLCRLEIIEKKRLITWLNRLKETQCTHPLFKEKLACTLIEMLDSVMGDVEFKIFFFSYIAVNNEDCSDKAAMGFNELYTAWKLLPSNLFSTRSLKSKLNIALKAAKTEALRNALRELIEIKEKIKVSEEDESQDEGVSYSGIQYESVEIYLYYEINLAEELDLLTVFKEMKFGQVFGECPWIDKSGLIKTVKKTYLDFFIELEVFKLLVSEDKVFDELIKKEDEFYSNLIEKELFRETQRGGLNSLGYLSFIKETTKERKVSRLKHVKDWLHRYELIS